MQGAAGAGQALAAGQLAALILTVGTTRETDAYLLLFSATQLVASVVVFGVLQPIVLSKPGYSGWRAWQAVAAGCVFPVVALTALYLTEVGYPSSTVTTLAPVLAVSGAVACAAAVNGVHLAMLGRPAFSAALTVPPNALAILGLMSVAAQPVTFMCVGLLVGNLLMLAITSRAIQGTERVHEESVAGHQIGRREIPTLASTSLVGAGGPFLLQSVVSSYPPGDATILGTVVRIGSGILAVGITAYAMTVTDWTRRSDRPLRDGARYLTTLQLALGMLVTVWLVAASSSLLLTIVSAAFWLCGASSQALATRAVGLAGRYGLFARGALYGAVAYPAAALVLAVASPSATVFLVVLAMVASGANLLFLAGLDWRAEWRIAALNVLVSLSMIPLTMTG